VPDDGRPDWPLRRRNDEVVGSKPATPTGPGSEPTSVTHGSFLYNSIYRFDDQAAAPPRTAARTKTSGCRAMTTSAGSLQAPTWRIKTLSANVSGICA
jgi:hypothetical protein